MFIYPYFCLSLRQRPYHVEYTGSRPITEVKQRWARLVLGWVTAWEHRVLLASLFPFQGFLLCLLKALSRLLQFIINNFHDIMTANQAKLIFFGEKVHRSWS